MSTKTSTRPVAPLRRVQQVTASQQAGTELNPHYMWCTREFTLSLDCGHRQVRARFADPVDALARFPARVRCRDCPPVAARGTRRQKPGPAAPAFDPVASALITDMIAAVPDRQDEFLEWVRTFGRYEPDVARRQRAYAAMARVVVESYLPSTDNERAHAVHTALRQWHEQPSEPARAAVRRAARRLYNAQGRDGQWFAHRGILAAAKLASTSRGAAVAAVTEAPTWDTETRSEWQADLWGARAWHDLQRGVEELAVREGELDVVAECAAEAEEAAREIIQRVEFHQPRLAPQHIGLCLAMLTAYQTATCRHALSARIEPPDEQGWMRESCGECGQILRWTLWPHHVRALAALTEPGEADTCETCGDEIAEADLVANEDDGDAWHLECLDVVEQVRHLQATPGRRDV